MSARDELAERMFHVDWPEDPWGEAIENGDCQSYYTYADSILAAGWRPPARTVTTEAEMFPMLMAVSTEAEPAHVRDAQRRHWIVTEDDMGQFWCWSWRQEDEDTHRPVRIHELPGPLTILHEPEA